MKVGGAGRRVLVGRRVDFEVVDLQAGLLQGFLHALGALAAGRLGQQAPDHGPVARLEAEALDRFLAEREARAVQVLADIAEALGRVLGFHLRQSRVLARDDDAILHGVVDERIERLVARVAHHGDAVRLGGRGFLELLDHLLRIPVREDVVDLRAEIGLRPPWRRCRRCWRTRRPGGRRGRRRCERLCTSRGRSPRLLQARTPQAAGAAGAQAVITIATMTNTKVRTVRVFMSLSPPLELNRQWSEQRTRSQRPCSPPFEPGTGVWVRRAGGRGRSRRQPPVLSRIINCGKCALVSSVGAGPPVSRASISSLSARTASPPTAFRFWLMVVSGGQK